MTTKSNEPRHNPVPPEWQRFFASIDQEIGHGRCRRTFPELDGLQAKRKKQHQLASMYRMGRGRILKQEIENLLDEIQALKIHILSMDFDRCALRRERDTLLKAISTLTSVRVVIGKTEITVITLDGKKHRFPYR